MSLETTNILFLFNTLVDIKGHDKPCEMYENMTKRHWIFEIIVVFNSEFNGWLLGLRYKRCYVGGFEMVMIIYGFIGWRPWRWSRWW